MVKFAVPHISVEKDGTYSFHEGSLFKLNPDLAGTNKLDSYARSSNLGWRKIDFGFYNYSETTSENKKIVFLGINISDDPAVKKDRFNPPLFSKRDFEEYLSVRADIEDSYLAKARQELSLLIHDLRQLSTSIYHSAEEAKTTLFTIPQSQNRRAIMDKLHSITASQTMLSVRVDG